MYRGATRRDDREEMADAVIEGLENLEDMMSPMVAHCDRCGKVLEEIKS